MVVLFVGYFCGWFVGFVVLFAGVLVWLGAGGLERGKGFSLLGFKLFSVAIMG